MHTTIHKDVMPIQLYNSDIIISNCHLELTWTFALALFAWLDIFALAALNNLWIPAKWPWSMASRHNHCIFHLQNEDKTQFILTFKRRLGKEAYYFQLEILLKYCYKVFKQILKNTYLIIINSSFFNNLKHFA